MVFAFVHYANGGAGAIVGVGNERAWIDIAGGDGGPEGGTADEDGW